MAEGIAWRGRETAASFSPVIPGPDPGIHVDGPCGVLSEERAGEGAWMAGSSPAMTEDGRRRPLTPAPGRRMLIGKGLMI